jgi:hypothetical protein
MLYTTLNYAADHFLGCRLELPREGECDGCHSTGPLLPFLRLSDDEERRYSESDFYLFCSGCHFKHAQFRELKTERIPYWFKVAMRIRDYVPTEPDPLPLPSKSKSKKPSPQLEMIWLNRSPNS